ncbi:MAG: 50S ribosomal protein L24 [Planctomycetota bacterium]
MTRAVRKGDLVEVLSGNDRGKRGRVLRVIPAKARVVVQGVNLRWKHLRKSPKAPQGGRLRRETPLHVSNVMIFDEAAGTRTRVGVRESDGKKVRVGRKTGREIGAAPPAEARKTAKGAAATAKPKPARKPAAKRAEAAEGEE